MGLFQTFRSRSRRPGSVAFLLAIGNELSRTRAGWTGVCASENERGRAGTMPGSATACCDSPAHPVTHGTG